MFQDAQKRIVPRILEYKHAHGHYILLYIIYTYTKPGFNICFSMAVFKYTDNDPRQASIVRLFQALKAVWTL